MSEVFDRLAKMAAGGSRREVLKGLAGFLTGGFLFGLTGRAAARDRDDDDDDGDRNEEINERCRKYCASCRGLKGGVHGYCIRHCKRALRRNRKAVLCGTCSAKAPLTVCSGAASCCTPKTGPICVNLQTNAKNCGACGKVCTGTTPACCSGVCKDLASDVNNCGKCGNKCKSNQKCTKGVCG